MIFYSYPYLDVAALKTFLELELGCKIELWNKSQTGLPAWEGTVIEVDSDPATEASLFLDVRTKALDTDLFLQKLAFHFNCWLASPDLPLDSECAMGGLWALVSPEGEFFEAQESYNMEQDAELTHSCENWLVDWSSLKPLGTCAAQNHGQFKSEAKE